MTTNNIEQQEEQPFELKDYVKVYDYWKQFKIVGGISLLVGIIAIGLDIWFKMNY